MFFFFFNEDFRYELENFRPNPKLDAECRRAKNQIEEFQARFPLDRLDCLQLEEYVSERDEQGVPFYDRLAHSS